MPLSRERFRRVDASLSFTSQDEFELHFLSRDRLEVKSMDGATTRYRRAQSYAPSAAYLSASAGRYTSDETGSLRSEVAADGGWPVASHAVTAYNLHVFE